jgi:DNA-nicking Smr family endonuclease
MGKRRIPEKSSDGPVDSLLTRAVEDETDLHGLDSLGAEIRLESFLGRWAGKSGAVVRVITGRGNRSEGGAVLKPLVEKLLRGRLAIHVSQFRPSADGGSYLVEMR